MTQATTHNETTLTAELVKLIDGNGLDFTLECLVCACLFQADRIRAEWANPAIADQMAACWEAAAERIDAVR